MAELNAWQRVVTLVEVEPDKLPDVLHAVMEHLNLEIIEEATPDYTVYEVRNRQAR